MKYVLVNSEGMFVQSRVSYGSSSMQFVEDIYDATLIGKQEVGGNLENVTVSKCLHSIAGPSGQCTNFVQYNKDTLTLRKVELVIK